MKPFAGERIEEARRVTDQQPAGPRAARDAMPERPRTGDHIRRLAVTPRGRVFVGRRDRGHDRIGDGPGAVADERLPPRAP